MIITRLQRRPTIGAQFPHHAARTVHELVTGNRQDDGVTDYISTECAYWTEAAIRQRRDRALYDLATGRAVARVIR